jgi:hypothetical protein
VSDWRSAQYDQELIRRPALCTGHLIQPTAYCTREVHTAIIIGREMVKKDKRSAENMNSKLALVIKSGRVALGYKQTLKALRQGKAKLVFISNNCPPCVSLKSSTTACSVKSTPGCTQAATTN